jgi:hypothetical protein
MMDSLKVGLFANVMGRFGLAPVLGFLILKSWKEKRI